MNRMILTGLMLGSLRRIWPWRAPGNREELLLRDNVLPQLNQEMISIVLLMLVGGIVVLLIERLGSEKADECDNKTMRQYRS